MKIKWSNRSKNYLKFLSLLLLLGIITGIYLYLVQSNIIKISITNKLSDLSNLLNNHQSNFITHTIIISVFAMLSITIIGIPLCLFYYFYEGVSVGFLIMAFIKYKNIKGLLYGTIFIIINKLIYIILITYLLLISIQYAKNILNNKKDKKNLIINYLVKIFIVFIIILINDLILYLVGNKLLSIFLFIL